MTQEKKPAAKSEAKSKAPKKVIKWHTPVYHRAIGKVRAGTEVTAEQTKLFEKDFIELYAK